MIFPWQFWVDNGAKEFRTVNPFYTNTIDLDIYIKYYFIPRGKYHVAWQAESNKILYNVPSVLGMDIIYQSPMILKLEGQTVKLHWCDNDI